MSEENTNIEDYTIPELMEILEIESLTPSLIKDKSEVYIQKFKEEGNDEMSSFFSQVKEKLLESFDQQTVENWYENQYLETPNQPIQNSKITTRTNKTQEFDGTLKRERLAINQSKPLPFAQGEMNPTLRNQIQKTLNIDSTFRVNSIPTLKNVPFTSTGIWSSTNFTADLSEQMTRVLSLRLYSVQIPFTWYNIPAGSNCFEYDEKTFSITPGNYTIDTLKQAIDALATNLTVNIDEYPITGKINIESTGIVVTELVFFKTDGFIGDNCQSCQGNNYINTTLGWIMGFREPCYEISQSNPVSAEAVADLNGPKYLLLYLDEFNMNRINKGLVNIEDRETKLNLPEYYKTGNITTAPGPSFSVDKPECINDTLTIGNDCINETLPVSRPFYTQDLPRTLTQAQQYTVNEIIKTRKNSPNIKVMPPSSSNLMGLIPVKPNGLEFGGVLVENANSLTFNTRNYFGPVDIERIEVKLLDDKGNLLDLNGAEWSFSIISTQLYQY
jgi:hypothetical protein